MHKTGDTTKSLFIFGIGYSAGHIAARAREAGWEVTGTGRGGTLDFDDQPAVSAALNHASHILSSVPPGDDGDPVLMRYGSHIRSDHIGEGRKAGHWLGYLSSTGVYGDTKGAWVDETAVTGHGRRAERSAADSQWLATGAYVFRLPGIYGPGRSPLERVLAGKAQRIDVPGQVFSRIHVSDITAAVIAAMTQPSAPAGAYNIADDCPVSQSAVMAEACALLGLPVPPLQSLEEAQLSRAALAFYAENRRVSNLKAKRLLGWRPRYADYRAGLRALKATTMPAMPSTAPATAKADQ